MTASAATLEAQAADWIARKDGERWTPADEEAFGAWLEASPLHRVAYLRLNAAWRRADRLRALRPSTVVREAFLQEAKDAQRVVRSHPRLRGVLDRSYRIAAAIAAITVALLVTGDPGDVSGRHVYATSLGGRETVVLADGSKLTLNTATRLATRIDRGERTVWVQDGEAFFDVAHDAGRPFVVVAGDRRVTVVGTRFSLHRDGDRLEVDVVEGRVQLQMKDGAPILLTRGESAVGEGRSILVTERTERQTVAATSWLQGRLVFDQMTIADAAAQFNRYNRRKLVVADAAAASIRIGGSFDALGAEGFARLLQSGFGLLVDARDDRILISSPRQPQQ